MDMLSSPRSPSVVIDEEVDDGIIRCHCGLSHDDGHTVQCDKCLVWQHVRCFYISDPNMLPEHYYCESCEPKWFQETRNENKKRFLEEERQAELKLKRTRRGSSEAVKNSRLAASVSGKGRKKKPTDSLSSQVIARLKKSFRSDKSDEETEIEEEFAEVDPSDASGGRAGGYVEEDDSTEYDSNDDSVVGPAPEMRFLETRTNLLQNVDARYSPYLFARFVAQSTDVAEEHLLTVNEILQALDQTLASPSLPGDSSGLKTEPSTAEQPALPSSPTGSTATQAPVSSWRSHIDMTTLNTVLSSPGDALHNAIRIHALPRSHAAFVVYSAATAANTAHLLDKRLQPSFPHLLPLPSSDPATDTYAASVATAAMVIPRDSKVVQVCGRLFPNAAAMSLSHHPVASASSYYPGVLAPFVHSVSGLPLLLDQTDRGSSARCCPRGCHGNLTMSVVVNAPRRTPLSPPRPPAAGAAGAGSEPLATDQLQVYWTASRDIAPGEKLIAQWTAADLAAMTSKPLDHFTYPVGSEPPLTSVVFECASCPLEAYANCQVYQALTRNPQLIVVPTSLLLPLLPSPPLTSSDAVRHGAKSNSRHRKPSSKSNATLAKDPDGWKKGRAPKSSSNQKRSRPQQQQQQQPQTHNAHLQSPQQPQMPPQQQTHAHSVKGHSSGSSGSKANGGSASGRRSRMHSPLREDEDSLSDPSLPVPAMYSSLPGDGRYSQPAPSQPAPPAAHLSPPLRSPHDPPQSAYSQGPGAQTAPASPEQQLVAGSDTKPEYFQQQPVSEQPPSHSPPQVVSPGPSGAANSSTTSSVQGVLDREARKLQLQLARIQKLEEEEERGRERKRRKLAKTENGTGSKGNTPADTPPSKATSVDGTPAAAASRKVARPSKENGVKSAAARARLSPQTSPSQDASGQTFSASRTVNGIEPGSEWPSSSSQSSSSSSSSSVSSSGNSSVDDDDDGEDDNDEEDGDRDSDNGPRSKTKADSGPTTHGNGKDFQSLDAQDGVKVVAVILHQSPDSVVKVLPLRVVSGIPRALERSSTQEHCEVTFGHKYWFRQFERDKLKLLMMEDESESVDVVGEGSANITQENGPARTTNHHRSPAPPPQLQPQPQPQTQQPAPQDTNQKPEADVDAMQVDEVAADAVIDMETDEKLDVVGDEDLATTQPLPVDLADQSALPNSLAPSTTAPASEVQPADDFVPSADKTTSASQPPETSALVEPAPQPEPLQPKKKISFKDYKRQKQESHSERSERFEEIKEEDRPVGAAPLFDIGALFPTSARLSPQPVSPTAATAGSDLMFPVSGGVETAAAEAADGDKQPEPTNDLVASQALLPDAVDVKEPQEEAPDKPSLPPPIDTTSPSVVSPVVVTEPSTAADPPAVVAHTASPPPRQHSPSSISTPAPPSAAATANTTPTSASSSTSSTLSHGQSSLVQRSASVSSLGKESEQRSAHHSQPPRQRPFPPPRVPVSYSDHPRSPNPSSLVNDTYDKAAGMSPSTFSRSYSGRYEQRREREFDRSFSYDRPESRYGSFRDDRRYFGGDDYDYRDRDRDRDRERDPRDIRDVRDRDRDRDMRERYVDRDRERDRDRDRERDRERDPRERDRDRERDYRDRDRDRDRERDRDYRDRERSADGRPLRPGGSPPRHPAGNGASSSSSSINNSSTSNLPGRPPASDTYTPSGTPTPPSASFLPHKPATPSAPAAPSSSSSTTAGQQH
ncbi:SET domain-containing protein 3 [Sorochytrium milnesiophthora]